MRIGSKDRTSGGEEAVTVTNIVVNPGWHWGAGVPSAEVDDIALLELDHLVDAQTIQIASTAARPGDAVKLLGWGDTEPDSTSANLPTQLQQIDTKIVSKAKCADEAISAKEICTGNPSGTDGPCYGDSADRP